MGHLLSDGRTRHPDHLRTLFPDNGELTGNVAFALGILFWIAQAVVLAAPWTMLKRLTMASAIGCAWQATLATLLVSLPSLGIIGWLSPLYLASTLYPGWQLVDLLPGVAVAARATTASRSRAAIGVCLALLAVPVPNEA